MIGFPITSCLVSVLLLMAMVCVQSEDFCQSYQKRNYSLIVFSQNKDTILLIVGRHFWRLKANNSELVFDSFEASNSGNSREGFHEDFYDYALPLYATEDNSVRGIALYKDLNNTKISELAKDLYPNESHKYMFRLFRIDFYWIYENYFQYTNSSEPYSVSYSSKPPIVFTIFEEKKSYLYFQNKLNGSDNVERYYRYNMFTHSMIYEKNKTELTKPDSRIPLIEPELNSIETKIKSQLSLSLKIQPNITFIGVYLNSTNDLIFFLRIKDVIKYCGVYECSKTEYKVLISCPKAIATIAPDTTVWMLWILIAIIIVMIAMVLVFAAIFIYFKRKPKIHAITSGTTSESQTTESMSNYGTLKTIDSVTGYPIDKSKTETKTESISTSDSKEVKKGLPKKTPKPAKTIKGKIGTKPKKSPKPKK